MAKYPCRWCAESTESNYPSQAFCSLRCLHQFTDAGYKIPEPSGMEVFSRVLEIANSIMSTLIALLILSIPFIFCMGLLNHH